MSDNNAEFDVEKLKGYLQHQAAFCHDKANQEFKHNRCFIGSCYGSIAESQSALLTLIHSGYFHHRTPCRSDDTETTEVEKTVPARTPADDGNPYRCPDSAIRGTLR